MVGLCACDLATCGHCFVDTLLCELLILFSFLLPLHCPLLFLCDGYHGVFFPHLYWAGYVSDGNCIIAETHKGLKRVTRVQYS